MEYSSAFSAGVVSSTTCNVFEAAVGIGRKAWVPHTNFAAERPGLSAIVVKRQVLEQSTDLKVLISSRMRSAGE